MNFQQQQQKGLRRREARRQAKQPQQKMTAPHHDPRAETLAAVKRGVAAIRASVSRPGKRAKGAKVFTTPSGWRPVPLAQITKAAKCAPGAGARGIPMRSDG